MRKVLSNGDPVVAIDPGALLFTDGAPFCAAKYPVDVRLFNQSEGYSETTNIADVLWDINGSGVEYIVAVETPAGHAYSAARVKYLLSTAVNAGRFCGLADAVGARVVECSAETWRASLTGSPSANDDKIERRCWFCRQKRSAEQHARDSVLKGDLPHIRDATGLALVVATHGPDWVEAREAERREKTNGERRCPVWARSGGRSDDAQRKQSGSRRRTEALGITTHTLTRLRVRSCTSPHSRSGCCAQAVTRPFASPTCLRLALAQ